MNGAPHGKSLDQRERRRKPERGGQFRLGLTEAQVVAISHGPGDWTLIEVVDAAAVRSADPDFAQVMAQSTHAVIVVADTTEDAAEATDSVARVFAPASGIPEDPVTGAAHTLRQRARGSLRRCCRLIGIVSGRRTSFVRVRSSSDLFSA